MIDVIPKITEEHCISFTNVNIAPDSTIANNKNFKSRFMSSDRGKTWQAVNDEWGKNIQGGRSLGWSERLDPGILMSNFDYRVLYDCVSRCNDGFNMSLDGGKTWTHIKPKLLNKELIENISLVETGIHSPSRIYAKIRENKEYRYRMAVSDDYGYNFEILPWEIQEIAESRANSLYMYARIYLELKSIYEEQSRPIKRDVYTNIKLNPWTLAFSNDGGKTWELMDGAAELEPRLYNRRSDSENIRIWRQYPENVSTWKQYIDDEEYILLNEMRWQIESDPMRPEWIYVLKSGGLYISRDAGKTFRLSSLAKGKLFSIDRIAVDPLDGRYLYATVDMGKIYRSSDYGCSWELMPLPHFTN